MSEDQFIRIEQETEVESHAIRIKVGAVYLDERGNESTFAMNAEGQVHNAGRGSFGRHGDPREWIAESGMGSAGLGPIGERFMRAKLLLYVTEQAERIAERLQGKLSATRFYIDSDEIDGHTVWKVIDQDTGDTESIYSQPQTINIGDPERERTLTAHNQASSRAYELNGEIEGRIERVTLNPTRILGKKLAERLMKVEA